MKQTSRILRFSTCLGFMALSLTINNAKADIITFSGLAGPTGSAFSSTTQGTFTVTTVSGSFLQSLSIGNPTPSIDDPSGAAMVEVTDSLGLFTFNSVDLSSLSSGAEKSSFIFAGYVGGFEWFQLAEALADSSGFSTISSNSAHPIDKLFIEVQPDSDATVYIDNINVSSVPEPASYVFVLCGIGMLAALRRHRPARPPVQELSPLAVTSSGSRLQNE